MSARPGAWRGRRVVVLGLGSFGGGLGAARWLARQGADVLVTDRRGRDVLAEPARQLDAAGIAVVLGTHDGVAFEDAEALVVNPAVPPDAGPVRRARAAGVPILTEIGLALDAWPGRVVGITGSNGKSTTTRLCEALLSAAGVRAVAGGNLGGSLLDVVAQARADDVAVVELSSFMLEALADSPPALAAAVVTNVSPNHLDRHGTVEAYVDAKAVILARARLAVLNLEDPWAPAFAARTRAPITWFGAGSAARPADVYVEADGTLAWDGRRARAPLPGRMNALDLAAALLAARAAAPARAAAIDAVAADPGWRVAGLPHRMERVAEADGLIWIDDSASTTPTSTAASLAALIGPVVLIAGGRDKGLDPSPLVEAARARGVVTLTIGEQAEPLAQRLRAHGARAEAVGALPAAVARALVIASLPGAVLLSPGYSSHDQFVHFEARGARFAALAREASLACRRSRAGDRKEAREAPHAGL